MNNGKKVVIDNVDTSGLTPRQIQSAIDNMIYRREYQKQRNQRSDVKEKRREYNRERYNDFKKYKEFYDKQNGQS